MTVAVTPRERAAETTAIVDALRRPAMTSTMTSNCDDRCPGACDWRPLTGRHPFQAAAPAAVQPVGPASSELRDNPVDPRHGHCPERK